MVKPVRTTESDRTRGYRRTVATDGREHGLETNSHSLETDMHPNTMPMRHVIVPSTYRATSEMKPRKNGMTMGARAPEDFKVQRRRASASEMHEAAKHSPQVESFFNNSTLKHTAFTSVRRRNDKEE